MNVPTFFRLSTLGLACAIALAGCDGSGRDSTPLDDRTGTVSGIGGDTGGDDTDSGSGSGSGGASVESTGGDAGIEPGSGPSSEAPSSITFDNYETVLREAVVAANADALEADSTRIGELSVELLAGSIGDDAEPLARPAGTDLTFLSETPFDQGRRLSYRCEEGGSMILPLYDFSGPTDRRALEFDDCRIGGDRYDGHWITEGDSFSRSTTFTAFTAEFADGGAFAIDGDFESFISRGYQIRTAHWTDTNFTHRDAAGRTLDLVDFDRERDATIALDLATDWGQVMLADGSSYVIMPRNNNGRTTADFDFSSSVENLGTLTVSSTIAFDGDYYDWSPQDVSGQSVDIPEFPVSDLGSPVMLDGIDGASGFSIEPRPIIPAGSEQWNRGTFTVTAADGSAVVMSPSADDVSQVEIRVSGADTPILRDWSDGFQVRCDEALTGCS